MKLGLYVMFPYVFLEWVLVRFKTVKKAMSYSLHCCCFVHKPASETPSEERKKLVAMLFCANRCPVGQETLKQKWYVVIK